MGVGNELAVEHLTPIAEVDGISFGISAHSPTLARFNGSFRPAFRRWLLREGPELVLRRGGPGRLELSKNDQVGNRQFQIVT